MQTNIPVVSLYSQTCNHNATMMTTHDASSVLTPLTFASSTDGDTIAQLRADKADLQRKLTERDKKLQTIQECIRSTSAITHGAGKGSHAKLMKGTASPAIKGAISIVEFYINNEVWEKTKMLPQNWERWSEKRKSVCQMFMKRVASATELIPEILWHIYLVPSISEIFVNHRTNRNTYSKKIFYGKNYGNYRIDLTEPQLTLNFN